MSNRITWATTDASSNIDLEYTENGFLLKSANDIYVDNKSTEIDTGIIIRPNMPVSLIFDEYDSDFTIDKRFLILSPNEPHHLKIKITGNNPDYFKLAKGKSFAYMLIVQDVFITLTKVNARMFRRMS